MIRDPWGDLAVVADLKAARTQPPRATGLTMIIDTGAGLGETADIVELAGRHIDHWKLSFGTSVFIPADVLRRKIALIAQQGIVVYPGGTLFEAAIVQQNCRVYMRRARWLGFTAVEISDGTITLPAFRRKRVIECALDAGVIPITEVGKKDPTRQPSPEALADQVLQDLDWGAERVIIEGRESGRGIGIYDDAGTASAEAMDIIAERVGTSLDRIIWEAPLKGQQTALIHRFGLNVSLGNIDPRHVLALEALRGGLRFETFKSIAETLEREGRWRPDEIEDASSEASEDGKGSAG